MIKQIIQYCFLMILLLSGNSSILGQGCKPYVPAVNKYEAKIHNALVDVGWYDEWAYQFRENLPKLRLIRVNIQIYLYLKVQMIIIRVIKTLILIVVVTKQILTLLPV